MPINARKSEPMTYEDRISRVMEIIDKIHNPFEKQLLRNFVWEMCQRYITKSKELERFVRPEIEELDRRFIETILRDLNLNDGL